jgi:hypothetical protein
VNLLQLEIPDRSRFHRLFFAVCVLAYSMAFPTPRGRQRSNTTSTSHARSCLNAALAVLVLVAVDARGAAAQDGLPCPGEPTEMAISYGQAITCQINTIGDTDTFHFVGTTGDVIVIQAAVGLGSAVFPCFDLVAPDGSRASACTSLANSNRLDAVLTQSGMYSIAVRDGRTILPSAGAYDVILERVLPTPSPTARAIGYGETLNDQIDIRGDLDLFTFSGTAGSTIAITATGGGNNGVRACLELVAANNARSLACVFMNSNRLQVGLTQTGVYTVIARDLSVSVNTGPYTIELQCVSGCGAQPPSPPTGFGSTPVAPQGVRLFWTAAPTATSYRLVVAGPGLSFDQNIGNVTVVQGVNLPSGGYSAQLFSVNASGQSATAATHSFTVGGLVPTLLPPVITGSTVQLSWTPVSGASRYQLRAGTAPGGRNAFDGNVGATTSVTATNVPIGTYFVRVHAVDTTGEGGPSNEVRVDVGGGCTPGAVTNLRSSVAGTLVTLTWNAAAGGTSHVLEVGSSTGLSNIVVADVGGATAVSASAPSGRYFVRVRGVNACGTGAASNEVVVDIS